MNTIYQLPTWAETILVICVALMLAALGVWMMCKAVTEAVNAASRLEAKRRHSDTKALNKWQKLYEEEHQKRADDNAALIAKIIDLESEAKRMKQIMAKAKVADL
jgi:predicted PurR-regulated permease PerM